MFWESIMNNLPMVILLCLAIIICGADLIKAIGVWKSKRDDTITKEVEKKQKKIDLANALANLDSKITEINKTLEKQN